MKRKTCWTIPLVVSLLVSGCAPQASPTPAPSAPVETDAVVETGTLTVLAAASLTAAFQEIGNEFENQHPGVQIEFNFAGSQQLAQQIAQGAPAGVFASANRTQMDVVVKTGQVDPAAPVEFARNRLVVVYPKENPSGITHLRDLAQPGIKIVLAAQEVPAGQYAMDFIDLASQDASFGASYKDKVISNVVSYEDNVKAVLTKVSLGEADAGIVYTTDTAGAPAGTIEQMAIPDEFNVIASYPIAVVRTAQSPHLAQLFIDLVLSKTGQEILARYGFLPAASGK
jgi:molybdate transport system substrate-binding protein